MNIFMEGDNDEAIHFKDEDLITLKAQLEEMIDTTKGPIPVINIGAKSLKALLARLEAAERVIQAHGDLEKENISYDKFVSLLKAWRKACGK